MLAAAEYSALQFDLSVARTDERLYLPHRALFVVWIDAPVSLRIGSKNADLIPIRSTGRACLSTDCDLGEVYLTNVAAAPGTLLVLMSSNNLDVDFYQTPV